MIKKIALLSIFILSVKINYAQKDTLYTKRYIQKIHIINPGVSGEFHIKKNKTLNYSLNYDLKRIYLDSFYYGYYDDYKFRPTISALIEFRDYSKYVDRLNKGKRTDKFSGVYGAVSIEMGQAIFASNPWVIEAGPKLGFQKAIGKMLYWDVNVGIGGHFFEDFFTFSLIGDLKFGFAF